jgi:predicted thioredoxin/glutaredoxin
MSDDLNTPDAYPRRRIAFNWEAAFKIMLTMVSSIAATAAVILLNSFNHMHEEISLVKQAQQVCAGKLEAITERTSILNMIREEQIRNTARIGVIEERQRELRQRLYNDKLIPEPPAVPR